MLQYLIKRLFTMAMTLAVISVLVFIIIKLPPGDYLTTYIEELKAQGENVDQSRIEFLRKRYGLDLPGWRFHDCNLDEARAYLESVEADFPKSPMRLVA